MISITPGYLADVAIKVWRHRQVMPDQRRVAANQVGPARFRCCNHQRRQQRRPSLHSAVTAGETAAATRPYVRR
jgi:DNA-directed RNA polymerase specialized sigma24 family protein